MATESSDPSASGQATTSPFAIRLVFVAGSVFAAMYATVFALAKSSNAAKNVLHKVNMWIHGIVHLIFTNETRWKPEKLDDPANLHEAPEMIKKTVIFIRHGESKWNEIFNDGKAITRFFKPTFFIRLFSGMFWETMDAVSGDSVFLDSPLSMEGVEQAVGLADFLERKEKCEDEKVMATVRSRLSERARLEIVILTESYQREIEPHEKPAKRSWRKRASTQTVISE
ncbi:hypothetical protein AAMO2058_000887600 [Amorphochlora amoebiformis]